VRRYVNVFSQAVRNSETKLSANNMQLIGRRTMPSFFRNRPLVKRSHTF